MFRSTYLPSAGAFFFNVLLTNAFLKNTEDLVSIDDILEWGFKEYFYTDGHLGRRAITPREHLENAEFSFGFPREFATMLVSLCITLTFSLLSPLILVAGLAYFALKHIIDRFTIDTVFLHDVEFHQSSRTAHSRHVHLITKLTLVVLGTFAFVLWAFLMFRLPVDERFLPHVICMSLVLMVTFSLALVFILIIPLVADTRLIRLLRRRSLRQRTVSLGPLFASDEYGGSWLKHAYTPPFQFIRDIHERVEMPHRKEQEARRRMISAASEV